MAPSLEGCFPPQQNQVPGTEQVGLKCRQRESVFTPLKARPRRPISIPERSSLRPLLIALQQHLFRAPLLVRIKPALLAALQVLPWTSLLALVLGTQQRPLLVPEQASFKSLHFVSQQALLLCPPQAGLRPQPEFASQRLVNRRTSFSPGN
jgi:hypothetical protein